MNNFARSQEKINWRRGFPVPATTNGVLFSAARSIAFTGNKTVNAYVWPDSICELNLGLRVNPRGR